MKSKREILLIVLLGLIVILFQNCKNESEILTDYQHDLKDSTLAKSWDEGLPLGNGMLGALIWEKDSVLRFSLDRADLWDLRPMENIGCKEWKFSWVYNNWKNNTYSNVQNMFDGPYDKNPAPSKIPAAAIEFNTKDFGEVESTHLYIKNGVCEVKWKNGIKLFTFVQSDRNVGWFRFEGLSNELILSLVPPAYYSKDSFIVTNPYSQDLRRLRYPKSIIDSTENSIKYTQKGWGGFEYQVFVRWNKTKNGLIGCWSISSSFPQWEKSADAESMVNDQLKCGFDNSLKSHIVWWNDFWLKSSINIPEKLLEKQWYLEMYKLGSCARKGAPPISLQAIWTADNGYLPPWKGDFHHDLNTQLSYWPTYSSNHIDLEEGFIDWLWKYRDTFKSYTKTYFETDGLNVPGVSTLAGQPMGGWIQYAFGPTVSAWLAQNFYLHWQYTSDTIYLKEKAYPWLKDVATYLEQISVVGKDGKRKLPISSSPEINDNSREAWFPTMTNFDLGLTKFAFAKASELAEILNYKADAEHWKTVLSQWPDYTIDPKDGLMFAQNFPYNASHRHFSHQMAIHPLGLIDWSNGEKDREIIKNTIQTLDKYGSDWWTGYSFCWLGNIKARAFDGEGAAKALQTFAEGFCLKNSFHVNGDQSGKGYSKFTYRPFTLEGNFAFAAGLQEMLIQSHTGIIRVFPAIPEDWKDVSFENLRTIGAFLVSAKMENGELKEVMVKSEKGGKLKLYNFFPERIYQQNESIIFGEEIIEIDMKPNEIITFYTTLAISTKE